MTEAARTATHREASDLIPESSRPATRAALLACADTKLLLGYHYGEWTFGAPALEAAIAACSMGQDELGHARLLQGLLDHFFGLTQDALIEERPGVEFANIAFLDRPFGSWADVVVANALVDLAVTLEIGSFRGSSLGALRRVVDKLLQEERFHDEHARAWFKLAAGRNAASREALTAAVRAALPSVLAFFGPSGSTHDHPLLQEGIKTRSDADVAEDLLGRLARLATDAGFGPAAVSSGGDLWPADGLPAAGAWNPDRRRSDPGGPTAEVVEQLSGARNVEFRRT
ncbi:MAG: phenylacetate-CoA oxygenase subunit PaaI [Gemmatimonadetes bacterium]|nr:phenylacetate-CoA oxygenase subunit PaaI [Gemmatimonadota bacterium]